MNALLAQLDRRLARHGEEVFLVRKTGTSPGTSFVQCRILAIVKPLTVEQLVGAISQTSYLLLTSPTLILRAKWPGGRTPGNWTNGIIAPSDPRIPTTNDFVYLRGAQKAVTRSAPIFDRGQCVRLELMVLG